MDNTPQVDSPPWLVMLRRVFRRFLWIGLPTLAWLLLGYFGFTSDNVFHVGCMYVSVFLFVFAMPVSGLLRLDSMAMRYQLDGEETVVAIALLFVAVNFLCWGLVALGWQSLRKRFASKTFAQQLDKPKRRQRPSNNQRLH